MRADVYLVRNAYASSRTRAKQLIEAGCVRVGGRTLRKASEELPDDDAEVELLGDICPYVSRGGLKLEAALEAFDIGVSGIKAIDIGASTGGFTDCLLSRGAARVTAVENGSGQLAARLRDDPRVLSAENFNARELSADSFGTFSLAVMDVSFISQRLLYPNISSVLTDGGRLISLIKPQFEAGRAAVGKNGIVRDRRDHARAIGLCVEEALTCGLYCASLIVSPIAGGDGNREYLALFIKNTGASEPPKIIGRAKIEETAGAI